MDEYEGYEADLDNINWQVPSTNLEFALERKYSAIEQSVVAFFEVVRKVSKELKGTYRIKLMCDIEKVSNNDYIEDPRILFYKLRNNQVIDYGDLNQYKTDILLYADIDEHGSSLLKKSNTELLQHFINLPDRNILPKWYDHMDDL